MRTSGASFRCPTCNGRTRVVDSRGVRDPLSIRRRRECLKRSKHRFTTYESSLDLRHFNKLTGELKSSARKFLKLVGQQ